mmetsp:Transcript_37581/g.113358  ORF Transcript_37581/g.113358 Transcript_37581/m.113358 type:complete len:288 (-) Transcript_37581:370-1233(-)
MQTATERAPRRLCRRRRAPRERGTSAYTTTTTARVTASLPRPLAGADSLAPLLQRDVQSAARVRVDLQRGADVAADRADGEERVEDLRRSIRLGQPSLLGAALRCRAQLSRVTSLVNTLLAAAPRAALRAAPGPRQDGEAAVHPQVLHHQKGDAQQQLLVLERLAADDAPLVAPAEEELRALRLGRGTPRRLASPRRLLVAPRRVGRREELAVRVALLPHVRRRGRQPQVEPVTLAHLAEQRGGKAGRAARQAGAAVPEVELAGEAALAELTAVAERGLHRRIQVVV